MQKEELLQIIKNLAIKILSEEKTQQLIESLKRQTNEILQKIASDEPFHNEMHVHTEYSLLDGVSPTEKYIEYAKELGHKAIAITDHRVTHGWYKLRKAHDLGLNPIYGCEVEVGKNGDHLVLLAQNEAGYQNILRIVSWSHMFNKRKVTLEILQTFSEGVIALSACMGGIVGERVKENMPWEELIENVELFATIFPNRFYLEVQDYDVDDRSELNEKEVKFIEDQTKINNVVYQLAEHLNLPLIATNDAHYEKKGMDVVQDILICINRKDKLSNPDRFKFSSKLHYMKNKWEMLWRFREHPEAVLNSLRISDLCNVSYQKEYLLPTYPNIPKGMSEMEFFKKRTMEGLREFYGQPKNYKPLLKKFNCSKEELWSKIKKRAEFEISVFEKMGFQGYILVVAWCVELAKEDDVLVGHARGSAAGSIVALANKITDVCPLKFDLLFERFLNPDRIEMPDIDIDYQYEKRAEVIFKVANVLGQENVAQIVTFGRMKARAALREVGRVMEVEPIKVDKLAKLVPFGKKIKETLELVPDFKEAYEKDEEIKQLVNYALMIEGKAKNYSVHAAGIILSRDPITSHAAFQVGKKSILPVIQAEMGDVDGLRLVKQDFLGVRILSTIKFCLQLIKERHNTTIDPYQIPQDDRKTYEMLARGESIACFQLESAGMRQLMIDMQVSCLEDIVDLIALYRPGVLKVGMHTEYVRNKFNPNSIKYIHPTMEPILGSSRGIMIYQEQAMFIAHDIAGFSMADADKLRKAIGKKKQDLMDKLKVQFVEGCKNTSNIEKEVAEEIWHLIEVMASYSFNKSHSVGYAFTSVDTAFLKANYPLEYMTSAIRKAAEAKSPKLPLYIEEAKRMGIKVLPPDINMSEVDFCIKDEKIIFGLRAIRDVGKASTVIVEEREKNGPFKDVVDFKRRCIDVNKGVLSALIRSGCFDSLGTNRNSIMAKFDELAEMKTSKKAKKKNQYNDGSIQISMLELPDFDELNYIASAVTIQFPDIAPPTKHEVADIEDEMLGIYITFHPLAELKDRMDTYVSAHADEFETLEDGQNVMVGGLIKEKKLLISKKTQKEMAKLTIDDLTGLFTVMVFPKQYEKLKHFKEKDIVLIKGTANYNERIRNSNNDDNDDEEDDDQAEYDIQVIAEDMLIFDHNTKLTKNTQKQEPKNAEKETPKKEPQNNTNENKKVISLSHYLEDLGKPNIVAV